MWESETLEIADIKKPGSWEIFSQGEEWPDIGKVTFVWRTQAGGPEYVVNHKQMSLFIPEPDKYRVSVWVSLSMDPVDYAALRTGIKNELAALMGDQPFMPTYELARVLTEKFGVRVTVVDNTDDGLKLDE